MREAGIEVAIIDRVTALILATTHMTAPALADAQIIVDIDLSILGRPRAEFDAYERAIRKEYGHVEEHAFRVGRAAILQKFLACPAIFSTAVMRAIYEATARENLRRSVDALTAAPDRDGMR